jgi:hypothetical protein
MFIPLPGMAAMGTAMAGKAGIDQLQACVAGHFDVEHSTFQLEAAAHAGHELGIH